MSDKDTGGPAFPFVEPPTAGYSIAKGMTLRDYFAAKAMATMLPTYRISDVFADETWEEGEPTMPELIAKDAYIIADAMLKARKA